MLESALLSVKKPSNRTLAAYKSVFNNESNAKGGYPALSGHSATVLDDAEDLMSMKKNEDEDPLTSLLRHCFPLLFLVKGISSCRCGSFFPIHLFAVLCVLTNLISSHLPRLDVHKRILLTSLNAVSTSPSP